jgi:hypothetical protein
VDPVDVPASTATLGQVAGLFEVADDLGGGAFGDPDGGCDVYEPQRGVGGDAFQDAGVVGDETKLMVIIS